MLNDILTIGDKIDITQLDHMGRPISNVHPYVSMLADFVDAEVINITVPMKSRAIFLPVIGDKYNLCFYTDKGLYQCNCIILRNYKENNVVVSQVQLTSDLEKYQRRQYFRLECIHDIEYRIITPEEEILNNKLRLDKFINNAERIECSKQRMQFDNEWLKASITDLSGGGARFNSGLQLHAGDKVRFKLDFVINGELKKLELGAYVVSSNKLLNRSGAYEHRIEFTDIGRKDREDLIKYIFEQDRQRRRNEKG